MKSIRLAALFLWSVLSPTVLAQETRQTDDPACRHDEFAAVSGLEGSWSVSGSVRQPDGEWREVSGRSTITVDLGGCILIERYGDDRAEAPFSALAMYSYDPIDGRLQKVSVDSEHGLAMLYRGGVVDGKRIFSAKKEIRGSMHYFVEEYTIDKDHVLHERRRSSDGRHSWRATSRIEYDRE